MGALERVVELLRPLVNSKEWDYCVIWELGDDPSSFIKWVDCCCGGGVSYGHNIVKEETCAEVKQQIFPICKDVHIPHVASTKACETLAHYPASMSLYSGIHGDVAITNKQMWLTRNAVASDPHCEQVETQVIIPVVGGLIELFSSKNVPNDQKLIEYITAHYNISLENEIITEQSATDDIIRDIFHGRFVNEYSKFIPRLQSEAPNFGMEGPPIVSTPSNGHLALLPCSTRDLPKKSTGKFSNLKMEVSKRNDSKADMVCSKHGHDRKDKPKSRQGTGKEPYSSKNVFIERNRRQRIKDGLFTLRALVPKISKMDRASILGDAVDYIVDLKKMIACFQTELNELEEVDRCKSSIIKQSHKSSTNYKAESQEIEVQLDIIWISERQLLLKFIHSGMRGGFSRLMEAIHSLGLQIIDINVTTCKGIVMNIFKIMVNHEEIEPDNLKDSLLTIWTSMSVVDMHAE